MEDDWMFFQKKNYVTDGIEFLNKYENDGTKLNQIVFNKNYGLMYSDLGRVGGIPLENDLILHEKREGLVGRNCGYWPHYSLQPSIIRTKVILELGNYDSTNKFFERDYAEKYNKAGYKTGFFPSIYSLHIGKQHWEKDGQNAYSLNGTAQFNPKPPPTIISSHSTSTSISMKDSLTLFLEKIKSKTPFGLIRPSDGEYKILQNETLTNCDNWTFKSGGILQIHLLHTVKKVDPNLYIGIPKEDYLQLNGEDIDDANLLKERSVNNYSRLLANTKILVIDEAQNIPDIGLILKLIVDSIEGIKIIATGSSVFDLSNKLGEPLVGRKNTIYLFPFAQMEFSKQENHKETTIKLEERLLFGSYPELEQYPDWNDKINYLKEILNSYLLKDILAFDGIKQSNKIFDLLKLIAFQVGREVSLQELARQLGISKNTVESYLDLLSKVFVIYKVPGFSKNLRKEITKSNRWYFYDNGIRNAIISNFTRLETRTDVGALWENYLASERIKYQNYTQKTVSNFFWRTYDQQELDWLEEKNGNLNGFEFKWNENRKTKIPTAFAKAYPEATFEVISKQNYLEFIT